MSRTVYFFGTCLVDTLFPRAGLAAMGLLRAAGVRVLFPQGQTCCGQPAANAGYRTEARAVARAQLDAFPGDLPILVPSASCAGMLKVEYPLLFADTPDADRAAAFADRVYEFADYLVRVLDYRPTDQGPPVRAAVHLSCSARRELGVAGATLEVLGRLSGVEAVEPERASECCGFGGTFAVKEPEISAAMASDKAALIRATGASVLIGQDYGCLMNLGGTLKRQAGLDGGQGAAIRVLHLAEFLLERTHRDH